MELPHCFFAYQKEQPLWVGGWGLIIRFISARLFTGIVSPFFVDFPLFRSRRVHQDDSFRLDFGFL